MEGYNRLTQQHHDGRKGGVLRVLMELDDVPSVLEVLTRCPWLPYSYPSLPTILPPSQCLHDAFVTFSLEVLSPWSFPTVAGAFRSSAELRSLPWSSLVFSEVLQFLPEFLLVRRSSSLSAGVPPCPPEFLLLC